MVLYIGNERYQRAPAHNVIICSRAYATLIRSRIDAFAAIGRADWRKCQYCGHYDAPEHLYIGKNVFHSACHNKEKTIKRRARRIGGPLTWAHAVVQVMRI